MGIRQKFQWTWPEGTKPLSFTDWIATALTKEEQTECNDSITRQHNYRQEAVQQGSMILTNNGYVWKDAEAVRHGKGVDKVWEKYWLRWQAETGVIFSTTFEEE